MLLNVPGAGNVSALTHIKLLHEVVRPGHLHGLRCSSLFLFQSCLVNYVADC